MINKKLVIYLTIFILVFKSQRVLSEVQEYSHHKLPPLYTFEEYDECFEGNPKNEIASSFCMVYAEVKPDNSSEIWQRIKAHSDATSFHYRYERLYFGLCLKNCMKYLESQENEQDKLLTEDDVVRNAITEHFLRVHKSPLDIEIRQNYSAMIHRCLNDRFEKKYNLKLRTFVEYCDGPDHVEMQEEFAKTDLVEKLLKVILQVILLLVILSTAFDFLLKLQQPEERQTKEFYIRYLNTPALRLCTSFSVCRNYYRLLQPYRSDLGSDLSFLDGFRSFTTLAVIIFHVLYTNGTHIKNPEFMESIPKSTIGSIVLNSFIGIEIFFVMSGIFLNIYFTRSKCVTPQTDGWKCIKIAMSLILQRFLRYLPSLGLLMLFNATMAIRLSDGPMWRHFNDLNQYFSRKNWWKNIFMINNFSQVDTMGPHTWYIGADFQLFIFYIIVLILMAKYPQYKTYIMKCLAVLAVAIPTFVTYFLKLRSSYMLKPETMRCASLLENDEYNYQYTPSYMNLGGYLFGIWCGDFYLNHSHRQDWAKKLKKFTYPALSFMFCGGIAIMWLGSIMMHRQPSLITALYNGLHRNVWLFVVCGIPTILMMYKLGGFAYEFCTLPMFRIVARLSFQMYLWHSTILQTNTLHFRQPYQMNAVFFSNLCVVTIGISIVVSFFTAVFVEFPFAEILQICQASSKRKISEEKPQHTKIQ